MELFAHSCSWFFRFLSLFVIAWNESYVHIRRSFLNSFLIAFPCLRIAETTTRLTDKSRRGEIFSLFSLTFAAVIKNLIFDVPNCCRCLWILIAKQQKNTVAKLWVPTACRWRRRRKGGGKNHVCERWKINTWNVTIIAAIKRKFMLSKHKFIINKYGQAHTHTHKNWSNKPP